MRHCFFVHTQLQLLVVQMIIEQKGLNNTYLVLSASKESDAANNYRILLQEELWDNIDYIENYQNIITAEFFCLCGKMLVRDKIAVLVSLLKEKRITHVYFGDQNNITIRYLIQKLKNLQFLTHLYEEGTSHYKKVDYTRQYSFCGSIYLKLISLYNTLFFGVNMYSIFKGRNFFTSQLIDKRFNLLPLNNELYDEKIIWLKQHMSGLNDILESELNHITRLGACKPLRLYLTQPLTDLSEHLKFTGLELLKAYLLKENTSDFVLVLKYHPRESAVVKAAYLRLLQSLDIRYYIISEKLNMPIEILGEKLEIESVISIASSASFYMQYCLGIKAHYLYESLRKYCMESNITSAKIDNYLTGFKMIDSQLKEKVSAS